MNGTNVREMFERAAEFELADNESSDSAVIDDTEKKSTCCGK